MPQHVVLSLVFEKSLQAVNPAVSLPYWDFVRDGQWLVDFRAGNVTALAESVVFRDDWFGSISQSGNEIMAGRWAAVKVEADVWNTSAVHNSYGLLRSPWNNNNLRGVTRSMASVCGAAPTTHPIPSCATYQSLFQLDTWEEFAWEVPTKGHGALHVNIGGAFGGCSTAFDSLLTPVDDGDEDEDDAEFAEIVGKVRLEAYHIMASLYRSGLCAQDGASDHLQCPEFCSLDTPADECVCECRGARAADFNYTNLLNCMAENGKTRAALRALAPKAQERLVRVSIRVNTNPRVPCLIISFVR